MQDRIAIVLSASALFLVPGLANAQGCVAVRHMVCANHGLPGASMQAEPWTASLGYRYFNSYKHFVGSEEQHERVDSGTQVINDNHGLDLGLSYQMNPRLNLAVNVPYSFNYRSSLYEHYGNSRTNNPLQARFSTEAHGIGDIRVSATSWILDPAAMTRGNFTLGLGIKLPTGEAGATDYFHRRTASGRDSVIMRPVDQSIQPGDGGWGVNVESQGFLGLHRRASLYYNGFYLFNPRTTNNVARSGSITGTPTGSLTDYFSVPDQYMFRAGADAHLPWGFRASLGGRVEGVPAYDAFGGSRGFRRPGYIVSLEPTAAYRLGDFGIEAGLPVALYRNRIKSFSDDRLGRHGDAAFADYLLNVNLSYSFATRSAPTANTLPVHTGGVGVQ